MGPLGTAGPEGTGRWLAAPGMVRTPPPRPPAARTSAHSDLLFRESFYSYHVSVVLLGHMASSGLLHSIRRKVFRHTSFFQAEVLTLCVKYVFFFFFSP